MPKQIKIEPITRIEGHARVILDLNDNDEITAGRLQVLEIRGFEKLLENMELVKMPLVTGRICGVCPAAHHLASVVAIENGAGIIPPLKAKLLRELLYAGHILHSHALSTFVLLGPDIVRGIDAPPQEKNIFHLLSSNPELARKALRLRSIGQRIVEIVGGRGVHPVTLVPGGIASQPTGEELDKIREWGSEALKILMDLHTPLIELIARLESLRDATILDYYSLAITSNGKVDFGEGVLRVCDSAGNEDRIFEAEKYADHFIEHVMSGSYMKSVHLKGEREQEYFVGPLARMNVNDSFSTPRASELMQQFKSSGTPRLCVLDNIEARIIEMVHCAERIAAIPSELPSGDILLENVTPGEGRYIAAIEAPRGILVHDYTADSKGKVTGANLIVATQNNYDAINTALTLTAREMKKQGGDELMMNGIEFAVRCFDPCLACATHAAGKMPMTVEVRKAGTIVNTLTRGVME
ncbi:MAG: Ni/Fe hydrogenase subunit alpha [Chitinivibrionales bacterium]|nr:Ni/Fe hydrogenase subunit alpha [Chitinivibrionales bacterium]